MKNQKPKIGCLTTFFNFNLEFSLCGVVKHQLISLIKHGYKPVLFVLENFSSGDVPEGVEVRKILPQLILEPYTTGKLDNLEADVAKAKEAMEANMTDIDVCLTHDIIFINSYLPYNIALREAIGGKLNKVKWLHWIHSGPSFREPDGSPFDNLRILPPNSKLVYMNQTDVVRAAEMYGVLPSMVRVIFNPCDIRELYAFHPLTRKLIDEFNLMSPDYLCVYPLSSTRMDIGGKQLGKVIQIMGNIKRKGGIVGLVVPNAHANADKEKQEIERMYKLGEPYGLTRKEIIFTSMFEVPNWEQGVPHEVVMDFFTLGNLFIFPSVSENCPLILLEAMAGKNLLVLNHSFPAMRDFALENALYFRFPSLVDNPQFPEGEEKYYEDVATLVMAEMNNNKALKANTILRQRFNVDFIFRRQLEPAIMEIYNETPATGNS